MEKKEKYIQFRISEREKEEWESFAEQRNYPSISHLIRRSVREFIGSTEKSVKELLVEVIHLMAEFDKKELSHSKNEIKKIWEELARRTDYDEELKSKIIDLLSKSSFTDEQIVAIFDVEESAVVCTLAKLVNDNIVKINFNTQKFELVGDSLRGDENE